MLILPIDVSKSVFIVALKDYTDEYYYKWKWKSVKSINPCPSLIQTIYNIVKAHGGELKVETKVGEGSEFIIQLPVVWITDLPAGRQVKRIKRLQRWILLQMKKWKSVKSINPCPSLFQTSYDIVKAHGGELRVGTKEGEGSEFIIWLRYIVWLLNGTYTLKIFKNDQEKKCILFTACN